MPISSNKSPDFPTKLTLKDAFYFPVASPEARWDILIGGLSIFLLIIGWILNLGNRLNIVSRFYRGDKPYYRGFRPWLFTFKRGLVSFAAISCYLAPSVFFGVCAFVSKINHYELFHYSFAILSAFFFVLGVFTLPGGMTVYAVENSAATLQNPLKAFARAWAKRKMYGYAWIISLTAITLSFFGLLALGIGFFFTSVWAWEVVGYSFTVAMYND